MITYHKLFILSGQLYDCNFILCQGNIINDIIPFAQKISLKISLSSGNNIISFSLKDIIRIS